jgi:hypothetical protein
MIPATLMITASKTQETARVTIPTRRSSPSGGALTVDSPWSDSLTLLMIRVCRDLQVLRGASA